MLIRTPYSADFSLYMVYRLVLDETKDKSDVIFNDLLLKIFHPKNANDFIAEDVLFFAISGSPNTVIVNNRFTQNRDYTRGRMKTAEYMRRNVIWIRRLISYVNGKISRQCFH